MTRPAVLITDGEQRAGLAVVRSLGQAGYSVFVTSSGGRSLAGSSRYCRKEFQVADPLVAPQQFGAQIDQLCRDINAALLIPISEASLLVLRSSDIASNSLIPFPDLSSILRICDKAEVLSQGVELGVRVPEQFQIATPEAALRLEVTDIAYPAVVKPSRSVSGEGDRRVKTVVSHVASPEDFARIIERLPGAAYPLLVQQRIVGPGLGVFLLLWDGKVVARFCHRRIREKPPSGGVSVYREGIAPDDRLVDQSIALLKRLGWNGVAMIEYKVDAASGVPYLMEINGRFWGSLQLAVDSGVNFPRLLAELATGGSPSPVMNYKVGIKSRWWWGDVDQLIAILTKRRARLGVPPGFPGRVRSLLDFLVLWRPGDRNEIFRWNDPVPFVRETLHWLGGD